MGRGREVKKYNSMLKKVFLILAILTMAVTVCLTVIFVLPGIKDPLSLLTFSRTRYVVFSFVLFALWTGVVVLLVWLESRVMKQKSTGMIVLAGIINAAALLCLLFSLILSASSFSGNVGTIRISNAEELSYIRNYPRGDFILIKDIDMKGEEWKSISKYKGRLNGNGHSIINITLGKNGFIKENLGEISSLTLSKVRYTDFEPDEEFGSLVKNNRGSVLNCVISSADVKATPAASVLVGCNYGICKNNTGTCNDRCKEHTYKLVSSTPATFLKHGANSYLCRVCGDTYTSVAVYAQLAKLMASILLLLIAIAGIIVIASSHGKYRYRKYKYIGVTILSIVALFMAFVAFSYETVGANAGKGGTWIDRWLANEEQTEITASPTASTVQINGSRVVFDAYNINGNNYFKLRDLAYVLNGTDKQFEVSWDAATKAIILTAGQPYTAIGGELAEKNEGKQVAKLATFKIFLNGQAMSLIAYTIKDNNYFKLRDVGEVFNFGVDWDKTNRTIIIDTSKEYTVD